MKKILLYFVFIVLLTQCTNESYLIDQEINIPDSNLEIPAIQGLKLQDYIVQSDIKINTKLPSTGIYKIKIYNFQGRLVNQEKIQGVEGDNILHLYVSSLPKDSYTIKLQSIDNETIGSQIFSKN
jgi:hypothetical protein